MNNPQRVFVWYRSEFLIVLLGLISILVTQWRGLANLFGAQPPQAEFLPPLPDLSLLFLFVLIPLVVFQLTRYATSRVAWAWGASVLVLTLELLSYHWAPGFWSQGWSLVQSGRQSGVHALHLPWAAGFLYGAFFLIFLTLAWLRHDLDQQQSRLVNLAMLGILALAFVLRWQMLLSNQGTRLDPDMMGYRAIADTMSGPYDVGTREPLWPWAIKAWFLLFGSSYEHVKMLTAFLSVTVLYAVYRFVRSYTANPLLALLTMLFMATNAYLVYQSARGLRLELYTLIVIMLARYVLLPAVRPGQRLSGLSLWSTLVVLLRFNSFTFILPLLFYAFWRHKLDWRKLALPILSVVLFMTPYLVHNAQQFGDPFWSANLQAIWYRNYEFLIVKKTGCQGCPPLEEVLATDNYFGGSRTTNFNYLFGMHSFGEVVTNTARGYWRLFVSEPDVVQFLPVGRARPVVLFLYLVGLVLLLFSRWREVLLFPLLTINMIAFIANLGGFALRYAEHAAPFTALALAYGVWTVGVALPRAITATKRAGQGLKLRTVWTHLQPEQHKGGTG